MPNKSSEEVFSKYDKDPLHRAYYRIAQLEDNLRIAEMALSLAVNYLCWLKESVPLDVTELAGGFEREYWRKEARKRIREIDTK